MADTPGAAVAVITIATNFKSVADIGIPIAQAVLFRSWRYVINRMPGGLWLGQKLQRATPADSEEAAVAAEDLPPGFGPKTTQQQLVEAAVKLTVRNQEIDRAMLRKSRFEQDIRAGGNQFHQGQAGAWNTNSAAPPGINNPAPPPAYSSLPTATGSEFQQGQGGNVEIKFDQAIKVDLNAAAHQPPLNNPDFIAPPRTDNSPSPSPPPRDSLLYSDTSFESVGPMHPPRYGPRSTFYSSQGNNQSGDTYSYEDRPVYPDEVLPAPQDERHGWAAFATAAALVATGLYTAGFPDRQTVAENAIDAAIRNGFKAAGKSHDLRSIIRDYELPPGAMPFLLSATAIRDTELMNQEELIQAYLDEITRRIDFEFPRNLHMMQSGEGFRFCIFMEKIPDWPLADVLVRDDNIPDIAGFDAVNLRTAMGAYILSSICRINADARVKVPALSCLDKSLTFKTRLRLILAALQYFPLPPLTADVSGSGPVTQRLYLNSLQAAFLLFWEFGLYEKNSWKNVPGTSLTLDRNPGYERCFIASKAVRTWMDVLMATSNPDQDVTETYLSVLDAHPLPVYSDTSVNTTGYKGH